MTKGFWVSLFDLDKKQVRRNSVSIVEGTNDRVESLVQHHNHRIHVKFSTSSHLSLHHSTGFFTRAAISTRRKGEKERRVVERKQRKKESSKGPSKVFVGPPAKHLR
jgi:hypothetical protein